jgi:hypothetical protein
VAHYQHQLKRQAGDPLNYPFTKLIYLKDNDLKAAIYFGITKYSATIYNDRTLLMRETLTVALAFKDYLSGFFNIEISK